VTDAPPVDPDRIEGWRRTETTTETVFDLAGVEVTTATAVYEDPALRERMRAATGVDRTWRFFFATRVKVPGPKGSRVLRRLVVDRATAGFVDRLRSQGFADVCEAERRRLRVGDAAARAVRYEAVCRVDELAVDTHGWIAVWPDGDGFRLAGGAYPTAVRSAPATDADLAALLDPETFRTDLFDLIRATG
jgi:hypothetical protein